MTTKSVGKNYKCQSTREVNGEILTCDRFSVRVSWRHNAPYTKHSGQHRNSNAKLMWYDGTSTNPTVGQQVVDFLRKRSGVKYTAKELAAALDISVHAIAGSMSWWTWNTGKETKADGVIRTLQSDQYFNLKTNGSTIRQHRPLCSEKQGGCMNRSSGWWSARCYNQAHLAKVTFNATKGNSK